MDFKIPTTVFNSTGCESSVLNISFAYLQDFLHIHYTSSIYIIDYSCD